jgi:uncharacterized membrane protein HdeD (DUF308 family)
MGSIQEPPTSGSNPTPRSSGSVASLPRIWPGVLLSVLSGLVPLLVPIVFAYWCYSVYKTYRMLEEQSDCPPVLKSRSALMLALLSSPLLSAITATVSYGLLLMASRVVNAIVNHTVVDSPSMPVAFTVGVIGYIASYVVAMWCGIRITRGIVLFIKDRSSIKVTSGILEGVVVALSTTAACSLPILRSELWSPAGLFLCLSLQGLSFGLAFYELSKLSKQAKAVIGQTTSLSLTRSVQGSKKHARMVAICAAATLMACYAGNFICRRRDTTGGRGVNRATQNSRPCQNALRAYR